MLYASRASLAVVQSFCSAKQRRRTRMVSSSNNHLSKPSGNACTVSDLPKSDLGRPCPAAAPSQGLLRPDRPRCPTRPSWSAQLLLAVPTREIITVIDPRRSLRLRPIRNRKQTRDGKEDSTTAGARLRTRPSLLRGTPPPPLRVWLPLPSRSPGAKSRSLRITAPPWRPEPARESEELTRRLRAN